MTVGRWGSVAMICVVSARRATSFLHLCHRASQHRLLHIQPLHQTPQNKNLWSIEECLTAYHSKTGKVVFVDGSWYHKGGRNGRQEFNEGPRIPGAHYLDMDDISTSKELFPAWNPKGLRVMFPPEDLFAATMDAMGITNKDQVIVYGRRGCLFTPRTWYTFRTFGQERVGLMQGSVDDWMEQGGPVDTHPTTYDLWAKDIWKDYSKNSKRPKYIVPANAKERFVDMNKVLDTILKSGDTPIVDTRGSSFAKGHIPGALHIPYSSLVQQDNKHVLRPKSELQAIFKSKGLDPNNESCPQILLSCGTGVSVCHMALVLEELGYQKPLIYDGGWNEWGSDPTTPKLVDED